MENIDTEKEGMDSSSSVEDQYSYLFLNDLKDIEKHLLKIDNEEGRQALERVRTRIVEERQRLRETVANMRNTTSVFYSMATRTGCHPFIEFCGLMGEYVKVCEQTLAADKDFTQASIHAGRDLVIHPYNMEYLAEKFTCIFETTLQNKDMKKIFLNAVEKKLKEH